MQAFTGQGARNDELELTWELLKENIGISEGCYGRCNTLEGGCVENYMMKITYKEKLRC